MSHTSVLDSFRLDGKIALVTGGARGLGLTMATALAEAGADVALSGRSLAPAEEAAAKITAATGRRAKAFVADVTVAADVDRLVTSVEKELGPIDILVNNAGDLIERRSLLEMSEAMFRQVLDVNLTSTFLCCQAVAPSMIARGHGAIINMSSLAAHNGGGPGAFAYAAAKAAVMALTKAIAKELAPKGVRANCVSPGLIGQTQFHGRFTAPAAFDAAAKTVPLGRAGTPEDVAHVVAFLASDEAAYLAGETIEINGGMFMR
jgi:3-oxoacyl-[acyl-carrier protein] reductase